MDQTIIVGSATTSNAYCAPMTQWIRLIFFALSEAAKRRPTAPPFASVMIPNVFANSIANRMCEQGYQVRISQAYTPESRTLTVWAPRTGMLLPF